MSFSTFLPHFHVIALTAFGGTGIGATFPFQAKKKWERMQKKQLTLDCLREEAMGIG
jgi:hypothetical protein